MAVVCVCRLHSHNMDTRERMAAAIKGCKGLTEISGLWDLDEDSAMILMPIAPCLTRLDLTYASLGAAQLSALISSCVNLDDLKVRMPARGDHVFWLLLSLGLEILSLGSQSKGTSKYYWFILPSRNVPSFRFLILKQTFRQACVSIWQSCSECCLFVAEGGWVPSLFLCEKSCNAFYKLPGS